MSPSSSAACAGRKVVLGYHRSALASLHCESLIPGSGATFRPDAMPPPTPSATHLTYSPSSSVLYCQRIQYRYFDSRKKRKRKKGPDPFKILKIPEGILYKDAKKHFLLIAMKNHPDTVHDHTLTEEERHAMRDKFIQSRIAFEELVEDPVDGTALRKAEAEENALDNFDSWFKNETGFETPFQFDMDPETMKEVASMTETIGGDSGLDRDGGMWALARLVTQTVKTGGDAATMLRLDAGDPKDPKNGRPYNPNGELRRRRKR